MKRNSPSRVHVAFAILLVCAAWWGSERVLHGQEPGWRGRGRDRGQTPRAVLNGKNDTPVRAAFREAAAAASAATVRVLADGEEVALGAMVDSNGYLVTKASVLSGKILCRFGNGAEREAVLMGEDPRHDLALLRIEARNLPTVSWREGESPSSGSLVAATGPTAEPLAIGVVSSDVRRISGPAAPLRPRGWLGVGLGGGELGLGVESVTRGSPAAQAGFRVGDEIRKINGVEMKSADQIIETVVNQGPRQTLKLLVHREESDVEISATLAKLPLALGPQDHWGGGPFSERRTGFPAVLPHDTPLHPKDCGGPLVDTDGRVVGINIARALRVTTFALPASVARPAIGELLRKVPRATAARAGG